MKSQQIVFDDQDINYLEGNATKAQLRNEIHWAQIAGTIADQFRGTPYEDETDYFPYHDYREACERALQLAQCQKPKPKPIAGRVNIADLKQSQDIVSVISQYTKLRKVGNRFIGKCPIHQDKNPSLVIYPGQQNAMLTLSPKARRSKPKQGKEWWHLPEEL